MNALQERGDEVFVYTEKDAEGNLSGEKSVSTGLSDGNIVEITEGLSEGDTIYYQKIGTENHSSEIWNSQEAIWNFRVEIKILRIWSSRAAMTELAEVFRKGRDRNDTA